MKIHVYLTHTQPAPWVDGLQAALPEHTVALWSPGAGPADAAVVWAPSQDFLDAQPGLKVIFNTGAGVDALLPLRWPAQSVSSIGTNASGARSCANDHTHAPDSPDSSRTTLR